MHTRTNGSITAGGILSLVAMLILLAAMVLPASAAQLSGPAVTATAIGETIDYPIMLDEAPAGLAGYSLTVTLANPSAGEITAVTFPSWATLKNAGTLPADSVKLKAADLSDGVPAGSTGITLATLSIRADAAGTTPVTVTLTQMDDDSGGVMSPAIADGSFTVPGTTTPEPTPTSTIEPTETTTPVIPAPAAAFSAVPTSGTAPLDVQFTDASIGDGISARAWDFDNDGVVDSTEENPSYTYTTAGTYSVKLVVTGTGGSGETTKTGFITVTDAVTPTETATPEPTATTIPAHTVPVMSAAVSGNTVIVSWDRIADSDLLGYKVVVSKSNPHPAYPDDGYMYWITDRETTSATLDATSAYNGGDFGGYLTPGETYYFSVTAIYEPWEKVAGNTVRLTFPGTVTPEPTATATPEPTATTTPAIPAPAADFFANATSGTAPFSVRFTDNSTGEGISAWAWDFTNDGIADSAEQSPAYTYTTAGTYSVKLVVTGTGGSGETTKTDYITVSAAPTPTPTTVPKPVAGFSGSPTSGYAPLTVQFTDESTGDISNYYWDFNNDLLLDNTSRNPSYTYTKPGTYTVNLAVSGPGGLNYKVRSNYITVTDAPVAVPVARFSGTPLAGSAPLNVSFTDESAGSIASRSWDFDADGVTDSTEQNPFHVYTAAGNYSVNLTVTGPGGSAQEVRADYVRVTEPVARPQADFTANPATGAAPLVVRFNDTSLGTGITAWAWDFQDDGTIDNTGQAPIFNYTVPGVYNVSLTVTSAAGSDTRTRYGLITVTEPAPVAGFSAEPLVGPAPLLVNFTDASGSADSYAWDFENDGITDSTEQNPSHIYTSPGRFNVSLTVTGPGGSDTLTKEQYISATMVAPVANFTANQTSGYAPLTVAFSDASSGTVESRAWDFENDGVMDNTTVDAVHTYTAAGNYTVNLTVTNSGGSNSSVKTAFITVRAVPAPVAAFSANLTTGYPPLAVQFTDESTGAGLITWSWDFENDGTIDSTDQNPVHVYRNAGNYSVSLTVKGTGGSTTVTKPAFITVCSGVPPAAPKAEFTAKPTSGKAPLTVAFTDKSVGRKITAWAWDFNGDGVTDSTDQNPSFTYTSKGSYNVTLTVTNDGGSGTKAKKNFIRVSELEKPQADFKADRQSGNAPLKVKFTDTSKGEAITGWSWDFNNDGTIDSTEKNPSYTFSTAGTYSVKLVVTNAAGSDMEVRSDYITVKGSTTPSGKKPIAVIFADKTWGTPPMTVKFADKSQNSPSSRTWFFGDGTSSTEQNPTHTYSDPGIYFARLYVENSAGTDQDFRFIFVLPKWFGAFYRF